MSKNLDKVDKILKQLSISERRQIVIKVATPLGSEEGSVDSVRLDLSPEDIAARKALLDALQVTDDDLVVELQRFCGKDDYEQVLESGLPKVLSISSRT